MVTPETHLNTKMTLNLPFEYSPTALSNAKLKIMKFSEFPLFHDKEMLDNIHLMNTFLSDNNFEVLDEFCLVQEFDDIFSDWKLYISLIDIVLTSQDFDLSIGCVDILYKILSKSWTGHKDKLKIVANLAKPDIFSKIMMLCRTIYEAYNTQAMKDDLNDATLKILKILDSIQTKRPRHQYSLVLEEDAEFILKLILENTRNREQIEILLTITKQICRTKKFCKIIGNRSFFDSLPDIFHCTQQNDIILRIIRILSKNSECLEEMQYSQKLCFLILDIVNNYSKTRIMKKHLITILHKILKKAPQLLSLQAIKTGLMSFLEKNNNLEEKPLRMAIIRVYGLLNLVLPHTQLKHTHIAYDLNLPVEVGKKCQNDDADTDIEDTDEEDFDNEDEDVKSDVESFCSDDEGSIFSTVSSEDFILPSKPEMSCMKKFYKELCGDENGNLDDLKIFQEVLEQFNGQLPSNSNKIREVLFNHVKRPDYIAGIAYPDVVDAEAVFEDGQLDFSVHKTDYSILVNKLDTIRNLDSFSIQKIYDLNSLIEPVNDDDSCDLSRVSDDLSTISGQFFPRKRSRIENIYKGEKIKSSSLEFESRFESGNLHSVEQIGDYEYNLFLSADTSSEVCHRQWFYFQVSNMICDTEYTFNIVNLEKINSQFNYGMQPVMFSVTAYMLKNIEWTRTGKKILYYGNNYRNGSNRQQRTLTFTITFEFSYDYCYIAYHYPYTYTKLMTSLLLHNVERTKISTIYSRIEKLCSTINGNALPLITVTDLSNKPISYEKRPLIFIAGRVHPGETNSSWIMDGILQCLFNEEDENASIARKNYIFKIIPMLNPDGCIFGKMLLWWVCDERRLGCLMALFLSTRSSLVGCDLNRKWLNPDKLAHPEIYYTKKLVEYAKKYLKHPIGTFIDVHGHSRKKYFFFYGCDPSLSWNKKDQSKVNKSDCTIIPTETSTNKDMKMSFCQYKIEKHKESTCRIVMWREFGIKNSFTLECSYCSGHEKKKMTTTMLQNIGKSLIASLARIALKGIDLSK